MNTPAAMSVSAVHVLRADGYVWRFNVGTLYRELPEGQAIEALENQGYRPQDATAIVRAAYEAARYRREFPEFAPECEGHPAGEFDRMGQTVYCDGSCRAVR